MPIFKHPRSLISELLGDVIPDDPLQQFGLPAVGRTAQFAPLPPEEQKSAVRELLGMGTGFLQATGNILDVPGAIARNTIDALTGGSANPLDPLLHPLSSEGRVGGRDLLERAGVLGANQEGFDAGDVVGFGADVLLDPLTYATFGASASGKGAQLLKKAGHAPKTATQRITGTLRGAASELDREGLRGLHNAAKAEGVRLADIADEPLGGLMGIGLPFQEPIATVGHGKVAQGIAKGMDATKDYLKGTAPVRAVRGLFDPEAGGFFGKHEQDLFGKVSEVKPKRMREAEVATEGFRRSLSELSNDWKAAWGDDIAKEFPVAPGDAPLVSKTDELFQRLFRAVAETNSPNTAVDELLPSGIAQGVRNNPEFLTKMAGIANDVKTQMKTVGDQIIGQGGTLQYLEQELAHMRDVAGEGVESGFGYLPRQGNKKTNQLDRLLPGQRVAQTKFGNMLPREEAIRYLPSHTVQQIVDDPAIQGMFKSSMEAPVKADYLLQKHGRAIGEAADLATKAANGESVFTPDMIAQNLLDWAAGRPKGDVHRLNPLEDIHDWFKGAHRVLAGQEAIHKTIAENVGQVGVPVAEVYRRAGFEPNRAMLHLQNKGIDPTTAMIPQDVANAIIVRSDRGRDSHWGGAVTQWIDKVNAFVKQNLNLPFPGSRVRDLIGGQWNNGAFGYLELKDVPTYGSNIALAGKMWLHPKKYADEIASLRINGAVSPRLGVRDTDILEGFNPGTVPQVNPFKGTLSEAQAHTKSPLPEDAPLLDQLTGIPLVKKTPGAGAVRTGYRATMNSAANIAHVTDWFNRVPMFLTLKQKGYADDAAAKIVNELQVDYQALAPFEKQVMRRLVPFYTFSRRQIPAMLSNMVAKPGGVLAQTAKLSARQHSDDSYLPPTLGEGMAFKVGDDRYLSSLGLPIDLLGDALPGIGPSALSTARRAGQKALSQLNPVIKGPLEMATGESFFAGRPVQELYQYPFDDVLANQLTASSPFSRYTQVARTLADERKGYGAKALNTLTGTKVTDISGGEERQRELAARKINESLLSESPGIGQKRVYYKKSDAELTPEEVKRMRVLRGMDAEARKKKKRPEDDVLRRQLSLPQAR